MSAVGSFYELMQQITDDGLRFFFISKGNRDIVKVIQYSFVHVLNGRSVLNLGFGDYDIQTDNVTDDIATNNGDVYKVLNTVLSTVPIFFNYFEDEMLMVQGSDGRPEFVESCKRFCKKQCVEECKNYNRRMHMYSGYVDKNFERLNIDYQFLGGLTVDGKQTILEKYERYKKYDAVFVYEKGHNFMP